MRPVRTLPLLALPLLLILMGCSELRELRERTVIQQRELTRLRDDLTRWQDSYYELHGQYEELGQRVQSEYRVQLRDLQAENERLRTSQSDAEAQLQDQVDTQSVEIERLRTQVSTLQSQLAQAQSDGQALLTRLNESESVRTGLQSRVSEMEGDLETVGEIADSMETLRAQLRQRQGHPHPHGGRRDRLFDTVPFCEPVRESNVRHGRRLSGTARAGCLTSLPLVFHVR